MKNLKLLFAIMAFVSSHAVYAACVTQSRGLSFYDASTDTNGASYRVVSQCQQNLYTSNSECSQSLRCDYYQANPYPSGQVACTAYSRGISFRRVSSGVNSASQGVVSECQQNVYTSNSECTASLQCADAGWGGGGGTGSQFLSCSTYSRGLNFERSGYDTNSVSQGVVQECMSNVYTSNSECSANLRCTGGGGYPQPNPYPQPDPYPQPYPRPDPYPQPYPPQPQPYPQPQPRPQPYPQPQPRPQPYPPQPQPYPGPGGGGSYSCSVTTQRGTYTGSGSSEGQATAAARSQCLGSETSYVCNAASVVCRR